MKFRKLAALVLSATLVLGSLAACGSSGGAASSAAEETAEAAEEVAEEAAEETAEEATAEETAGGEAKAYTIACGVPTTGFPALEIAANSFDQLVKLSNGTATYANGMDAGSDPDTCISFVEQSIAGGADGIVIMPPADSVLPTVATMCEQAQVYWAISMRSISDPEIKELVEGSEYYVGNVYEDEVEVGRIAGQKIVDAGFKNVALISTTKGNTTGDAREQGLIEVLEANGASIVGEARGHAQASEVGDDVASLLASNPDLDVIFQAASFAIGGTDAAIAKIQEAGRDVQYVAVDGPQDIQTAFDSGIMPWFISATGNASLFFDPVIAAIKVVNAIQGYKLTDDGANNSATLIKPVVIENVADAEVLSQANTDPEYMFFTDEAMKEYFAWENTGLTATQFTEMVQNYDPKVSSPSVG